MEGRKEWAEEKAEREGGMKDLRGGDEEGRKRGRGDTNLGRKRLKRGTAWGEVRGRERGRGREGGEYLRRIESVNDISLRRY